MDPTDFLIIFGTISREQTRGNQLFREWLYSDALPESYLAIELPDSRTRVFHSRDSRAGRHGDDIVQCRDSLYLHSVLVSRTYFND